MRRESQARRRTHFRGPRTNQTLPLHHRLQYWPKTISCPQLPPERCHLDPRHHRVVQALAALIRHTQPGPVAIETVVRNTASGSKIRADLTWTQLEGRLIIDVTVVDPEAVKYTKHPASSHRNPDSAVQAEEARKRAYYASIVPAPTPATIIPFVHEATGRLEPSALAFLLDPYLPPLSILKRHLHPLCHLGREHVRSYPGPVLTLPPKRSRVKTHPQPAFISNPHTIVHFFPCEFSNL